MNHYLFKTISITTLVFLVCLQSSGATELEWDRTKVEIELKPDETEAKAEFLLTNKSDETLHIDRIKTSCGCTGSILNKKTIKPGESTTIVGTFKKGNRQGLNHNQLQVFLQGQEEPVETLYMLVKVPTLIQVTPSIIYWNRSQEKTERQVQVKFDTRYLSEIESIEYDSDLLEIKETFDPNDSFNRQLTILPKLLDKQIRETVLIKARGENNLTAQAKLMVFMQP